MSAQPPSDDEPTVIRPRSTMPTQPATVASPRTQTQTHDAASDSLSLPLGTRLGEFELRKRLGEGGFGIVYQAWDHSLERLVALKEYLPSSIATRVGQTRITVRSERHRETFDAGLKSFINEAKLLARFDHASLVKVFRFWEDNGTAYMVMPFYEGTTMRDTVRAMSTPPDEAWLMFMLDALTEALTVIHTEQCFHRDIAPDNVMLLQGSDRPLLLDFGAARRVIGDMTHALTVILKPGYAPIEQYAEVPDMKQGPWTDLYALAAVVYWCITGKTPPPSVGRMLNDSCVPLAQVGAGRYSARFLEAIDRALVVRPELRTQSVEQLRDELGLAPMALPGAVPLTRGVDPDATTIRPARTQAAAVAARTVRPAPEPTTSGRTTAPRTVAAPAPAEAAAPSGSKRTVLMIGAAFALVALGGGAWWAMRSPAPAPTTVATAPPPAPAPTAIAPVPPPPAPAAAPAPAPVAAVDPPPPAVPVPKSAADAFAAWTQRRSAAWAPSVRAPATATTAAAPRLAVTPAQAGFVYVVAQREGDAAVQLWFPKPAATAARSAAGTPVELTPPGWSAQPAPGAWRLMAIVTRTPWDLAADGWQARGATLARSFDTAAPASTAACPPGAGPCDEFGAEAFAIQVQPPAETVADRKPARPPAAAPTAAAPPPAAAPKPQASAECARLLQQMSLGDSSPALIARFNALGCR